ncbi:MAG: hydrogenase expression/formation protein HypE [Sedimentisphaerales bacterium]|nr:hydrogenase expression/formation protein HypE [Sedimentisphaerales bacterium]
MKQNKIVMAHGGGGELTRQLLAERIIPRLSNELLNPLMDSAVFDVEPGRLCMTTDGFVVDPLEFPGGDIGRLAVCGTVNDLAVMAADPKVLSLALVLEEGLEIELLDRVIGSIAEAARQAGVVIGTGDTKVVEGRGSGGGMTITTAGVGRLKDGMRLDPGRIVAGDVIIVTGNIAEHGLAVMSARDGLAFETKLLSDVAPLNGLVNRICESGADIKFMRDPTRSGVAGVMADLVEDVGLSIELEEDALPVSAIARHTAELLGLDVLTVANEGKIVVVVSQADADKVVAACRADELGRDGAIIGRFTDAQPGLVELITTAGGRRLVQRPYGEDLPRIC